MLTVTVLHYFVQKQFDKRAGHCPIKAREQIDAEAIAAIEGDNSSSEAEEKVPSIYALLPIIPLFLILFFSSFAISWIKMNVITAMLISIFVSLVFEVIRYRAVKKVFDSIQIFFNGMGVQFATVVTLIVAGQTFAQGLKSIGAIDSIISAAQNSGFSPSMMIVAMTLIIIVCAVIMGSGNAPFFSFAALVPDVAKEMSIPAVLMLLPMQFASGLARSFSPITAVIVAISGIAQVSPIDVVKRTAIPMIGGLIVTVIMDFILN